MSNTSNITAYFRDVATRHPLILHSATNKRFFELEWDQMTQNGAELAFTNWSLILEDYIEQPNDNGGDYVSLNMSISFYIIKHVPIDDVAATQAAFEGARQICWDIIAKMKADEACGEEGCNPDVPAGVTAPRFEDLNQTQVILVQPPFGDNPAGARATVRWRTDEEVDLRRDRVAWVPLD